MLKLQNLERVNEHFDVVQNYQNVSEQEFNENIPLNSDQEVQIRFNVFSRTNNNKKRNKNILC